MDNKTKKTRWRLNVFDIVIIAVVLIAAAALLYFWRASGKSTTATTGTRQIHYTIELSDMLDTATAKIQPGDTMLDSTKKFIMGTVVSVTMGPTVTPEKNLNTGDTVLSEVPGKVTATITLVTDCSVSESEIKAASGYLIRVGEEVAAAGPGYAGKGYIVAFERGDLT
ncbi:DUF4330 family protein [Oscillospiraceae bacterium CM]|nr:DUF4330 family protein [Oscillospiraceae bacterium CM]